MATLTVDITLHRGLRGELPAPVSAAFHAPPGFLRIAGPSGAGKSTLLAAIAGVLPVQKGRITLGQTAWADTEQRHHSPPELRQVGWCPQGGALFPHMNAEENIRYGGRGTEARFRSLAEALEITRLLRRSARALSGGEASRVSLARALYTEPRVLLLDEPYAALDAELRARVTTFVSEEVARLDCVTLLVEHDRETAPPNSPLVASTTYNMRHAFRE